jgi:CII-binding regulator of phage lambda lysogenization HflD
VKAKLRTILEEWESSAESVEGGGVGPELIRVIRKIAQIEKRLRDIDKEIMYLEGSDLYQLKAKIEEAEKQRRDLLKEMASQIKHQITDAKRRLATATGEGPADE